jgi:alpha-glucosidase
LGVILVLIFPGAAFGQSEAAVLSSPDRRLTITFRTVESSQKIQGREAAPNPAPTPNGSQLVYEVSFQGKPLIQPSALRLDLKDQAPLGVNVRIVNATVTTKDESYTLVAGKASSVKNHFNALQGLDRLNGCFDAERRQALQQLLRN